MVIKTPRKVYCGIQKLGVSEKERESIEKNILKRVTMTKTARKKRWKRHKLEEQSKGNSTLPYKILKKARPRKQMKYKLYKK